MAEAQRASELAHHLGEIARQAADVINSQGIVEPMTERRLRQPSAALDESMKAHNRTGILVSFTRAFRLALQSIVLAIGVWMVFPGKLAAGAMIAASILLGRALATVEQINGR